MYSLHALDKIHFELSSHCNSKCPQCPRYDMQGRVRDDLNVTHLDLRLIEKLPIRKMEMLKHVTLCGNFGDPLMHPDLDKIIKFFNKQIIQISTNASLRSTKWWRNLAKNKMVEVTFCIDGIGEVHEKYRRNTSYDKIIKNAKSFIGSGGTAFWQFIVFKHNEHQIEEAKKLSKELGFKEINFMYSDRFDTSNSWKVYEDSRHLYDLEKATYQTTLRESLNVLEGEKYWKKLNSDKGAISCVWKKDQHLYIHSDGTVYPCCMLGSIQSGKNIEKLLLQKLIKNYTQIDLNHNTLEQILESNVFQKNLPDSFKNKPFSHPTCIEWCNKSTGKYFRENLATIKL